MAVDLDATWMLLSMHWPKRIGHSRITWFNSNPCLRVLRFLLECMELLRLIFRTVVAIPVTSPPLPRLTIMGNTYLGIEALLALTILTVSKS